MQYKQETMKIKASSTKDEGRSVIVCHLLCQNLCVYAEGTVYHPTAAVSMYQQLAPAPQLVRTNHWLAALSKAALFVWACQ